MLSDHGLVEDIEHIIYSHLSLSDCKSLLYISHAGLQISMEHIFSRSQNEFRHYTETLLRYIAISGQLPDIRQRLKTSRFLVHHPHDSLSLSFFLISARILIENTLTLPTINQLQLLLLHQGVAREFTRTPSTPNPVELTPEDKIFTLFSDMLVNHQRYADADFVKLKKYFAQAMPEQKTRFLTAFKKIHLLHPSQEILLAYLLAFLIENEQKEALELLKKRFSTKMTGDTLYRHVFYVTNNVVIQNPSQTIISYLSFIWNQVIVFETSSEYILAEDQLISNSNLLESSLANLLLKDQENLFLHYLEQIKNSATTQKQFIRAANIATTLAPYMHDDLQLALLEAFHLAANGVNAHQNIVPILDSQATLVGNLRGEPRNLALSQYLNQLPIKPIVATPPYYFLSFERLCTGIQHLTDKQYQLILKHALAFIAPFAKSNFSGHINVLSRHAAILISIAINYLPAADIAFECWQEHIKFIINIRQNAEKNIDEVVLANTAAAAGRLPTLAVLLPSAKRQKIFDLLKSHSEQEDIHIKQLSIDGLEKLAYFMQAHDQTSIIEILWKISMNDPSDIIRLEALKQLNKMAIRLVNAQVQAKIKELIEQLPHPIQVDMLQSFMTGHYATFFQRTLTFNEVRKSHAHSLTYGHS